MRGGSGMDLDTDAVAPPASLSRSMPLPTRGPLPQALAVPGKEAMKPQTLPPMPECVRPLLLKSAMGMEAGRY